MIKKNEKNLLPAFLAGPVGTISNPFQQMGLSGFTGTHGSDLIALLSNFLKFIITCAGIFTIFQLVVAGYEFMNAGGNADKITAAWNKIWQAALGLVIVASSLVIAAVISYLVFGSATVIISPEIYGPTS